MLGMQGGAVAAACPKVWQLPVGLAPETRWAAAGAAVLGIQAAIEVLLGGKWADEGC